MAELRWKWEKPMEEFSEEEKKILMGKVVELMVLETFRTHYYKWGGAIFK